MRSPAAASRSRIRGWRTPTGPMPVMISRSGRCPWRTTRRRPASVLRSECRCRKSATSASTACVSRARAPLRKISVSESMKVSGCASLMTLLSVMAYHSFSGEVEASNTPHDTPPYPFMPSPTSALSSVIDAIKTSDYAGVIVLPSSFTRLHRQRIIDFAARHQLPAVYWDSRFVKDGGLISCAYSLDEEERQGATYVDRILKGEKPGDLPV